MLAQRSGLPPGRTPPPLKERPDPRDVGGGDGGDAKGCCSLPPPPAAGGCPWARLAGLDGCLSEPYCLWFQLLARAYWGELPPGRSAAWARLRDAARKNCVLSRVRAGGGRREGSILGMWRSPGGDVCSGFLPAFRNLGIP
ncbi:hypothetical protein EYF80_066346 [Liparis tanakae]|uniref:Uncharacterized protein n=1 Tax=Liparis tanakae TaxID=230148 RepID=A0A4Z2E5B0_9TELE|nr:hypothetical protein EYF80_066346 [Liparis tanakae]